MALQTLDWGIILGFFAITLLIGLWTSRRAGKGFTEYFLSGRGMPWWLLGISMVATTFSADTPNLVADIVRQNGVAGNWAWWAFLLTGMLTVFVYAKLWRRSGILTDIEFYELRYSGKPAAFLRGFRAIYLGLIFNVFIMATVSLAAIKIGSVLLGLEPWETLLAASVITVIYTSLGGLRGVIITDFFQFSLAMIGMVWAAVVVLKQPAVGGLEGLLQHPEVVGKLSFLPDFNNWELTWTMFILPLAVQWWAVWYPGAEPGGGGYVVQRMLSAKNEQNAIGATLLFNVAHYALRPWPWILIALASLIYFPLKVRTEGEAGRYPVAPEAEELLEERVDDADMARLQAGIAYHQRAAEDSLRQDYRRLAQLTKERADALELRSLAYIYAEKNAGKTDTAAWSNPLEDEGLVYLQLAAPELPVSKLGQDLGFSLMLRFLPPGLLGLLVAALVAAFMSTLSTHLNWGASYLVNDVYRRFYRPEAEEKELVRLGRLFTVVLMVSAALLALALENALDAFYIILQIGAGTGLIFIMRWFWWRINAYSEITAMVVSFVVAVYFEFFHGADVPNHTRLLWGVGITTGAWLAMTWLTRPTDTHTLIRFYRLIRPHSAGWDAVIQRAIKEEELFAPIPTSSLAMELVCLFAGCFMVYGFLFATGWWLYGLWPQALLGLAVALLSGYIIWRNWPKVQR